MTIVLDSKIANFINTLTNAVISLESMNDTLSDVMTQWNAMAYATGANPSSNNITDAQAQEVRPSINAQLINSAIGAIAAVQSAIAANAGYLEAMRP